MYILKYNGVYDLHGWLSKSQLKYRDGRIFGEIQRSPSISLDLYLYDTEELLYTTVATPCYNGNISAKVRPEGRYDYTYNNLNQLTSAAWTPAAGKNDDFSTTYEYDARGNILHLTRRGIVDKALTQEIAGELDDLTMGYTGNRLTTVTATTEALPFEGRTGLAQTGTYSLTYDDAGNLKSDPSRGISDITYNHLGQPVKITFESRNIHTYSRDNLGNVLSITYEEVVTRPGTTTAYLSQFGEETFHGDGQRTRSSGSISTGKSPAPVMTTFQGGYFDAKGRPRYNVTDYQGNIVAVIGPLGSKVQSSSYYPYGELHRDCIEPLDVDTTGMGLSRQSVAVNSLLPDIGGGITFPTLGSSMPVLTDATQPHHYSGKELMNIDGQREYDFHARRHNSRVPYFTTMDPQAESYPHLSPYSHCASNPVMYTDPTGERITAETNGRLYEFHVSETGALYTVEDTKGEPFIQRLINTFNWMNSTDVGKALLDRALSSEKLTKIKDVGDNMGFSFAYGKNTSEIRIGGRGIPVMVIMKWVIVGWQYPSFNLCFAHELAHAVDWINGTYDASIMYVAGKPVRGTEIWAVEVENYLRYELGLPIRVGYTVSPIFNDDLSRGYSYSNTEVSLGENRIFPFWYSQHHFMNTSYIIDKIYQR